MSSKHPFIRSLGKKISPTKALIILLCLAVVGAAGIALQKARVTPQTDAEESSSRRFAGRTGSSVPFVPATRQSKDAQYLSKSQVNADGTITGAKIVTDVGIQRTVRDIMRDQASAPQRPERVMPEHEIERDQKAERPGAPAVSQWPVPKTGDQLQQQLNAPQTVDLSFNGATLTDTGAFPPDSMGAVGPTQFVTFVNGRLRTFNKTGTADGVINADPDVFFASVMTPVTGSVVLNFTSDPNVRYDRFTARWFLTIIDVPCTNATCTTTAANRIMIAVSDAASAGTITAGTVWTFFQFVGDPGTNFLDYPSLGVDVNALYIGGNMFSSAGSFVGTNGYVIQKSSILGAGPGIATAFANLALGAGAGPESPRGVDNFDSTATEGYIVGPDNASFNTITFRRVSNPGSASPTISANILVTVPTTTSPNTVEHLGNTGGTNGNLDTIDDRFFQAMIRNGRLWSAHNFRVSSAGVASTATNNRVGVRWYEFQNLTTTPTTVQSGTVFDNAATRAAARQYFFPSVIVSGQGHAVLGFTMAGTPVGATPAYVGRLASDTLGTMAGPPTVAAATFGTTTANYNPPSDPGGTGGRRWGDYSHTSLDPKDDMTIWTIQEYNQATNSYAVRVGKLLAPPPAALSTISPSSVSSGQASVNVTITGTSSAGSGFYDPGTNLPAPALPFTHISATVTGGVTVNSVTYTDPTHITLNLSTVGASAGAQNIIVTNPDGQTATGTGVLTIIGAAPTADLAITKTDGVTTATPGGSTTYTIIASNAGPSAATGATVADTFPAALTCTWTCVGAGGGTCTASGSGNINSTANLPSGGSVIYTASCSISASATGTLSNTATVTAPGGVTDPTPGNNSATDVDTLTPQANLGITKTDIVTSVVPGGVTTYTIVASNAGPSNASGSTVTDTFPAALTCTWTCVGANGGTCTASGSGNISDTANLPSGGSVTYTASCTIAANATGTLSNTATVATAGGVTDSTPGNNSATDVDTILAGCPSTLTVTDLGDTGDNNPGDRLCNDGTGKCTLRAAIQEANAITACTPLTINFNVTGTINLASALPNLDHPNLTITGPGADQLTVRRNVAGLFRIFQINVGKIVNLAGLTMTNGDVGSGSDGGGILNSGTLTITNCAVTGNHANGGGGIYNASTLTMTGSTLSGNSANFDGGGLYTRDPGNASLTNSTISGNQAGSGGNGVGGILNVTFSIASSTLQLTNCTIANNTSLAAGNPGGILTANSPATTSLRNTIIANNTTQNLFVQGGGTFISLGNNLASDNGGGLLNGTGDLINANPLLAVLGNYGGSTQTQALLPGSPAINAGTATSAPSTDQRGFSRVGNVDIGAFESRGFTLAVTSGSGQSTTVNTAFGSPLVATVTAIGAGEPVNGGLVTFTAPGSGASASVTGSPASISGGTATSGTLTANGTVGSYNVAASAIGASSINFGLANGCPTVTILPASLPGGTYNVVYANQTLTASGTGLVGAFTFALQTAGTLPPGLTLSSGGLISGTPTQPGSFTFTVIATNTASGCTGNRTYTVGIQCPTINIAPTTLPNPVAGVIYNQPLTGSGGVGPYTFALHAGSSLPSGLSLVGNAITGTPTQTGSFTFTIDVTDTGLAAGPTNCGGNRTYTVTVACPTISVTPLTVPSGTAGALYGPVQFAQTGGVGTISWSVTSGNLPAGLTLNPTTGALSGTPTVIANVNVTVRATDSNSCFGSVTVALVINCPTITVSPVGPALTAGRAGTPYSQTFTQTGGIGAVNFSVSVGSLPTGLTLSSGGVLSGTPSVFGNFGFTVRATDANTCFGERAYTLVLNPPCGAITITPATLPNGFVGTAYSGTLTASGGTASYTFATSAGALPNGVSLSTGGALSGTPTSQGTYSFSVTATDSTGCTGMQSFTVIISGDGLVFYPLPRPVRILDTRSGQGNCDNISTPIAGGTSLTTLARLTCEGITIPSTAKAITGNVTVINQTAQIGFLTIYPDGNALPLAANMIYEPNGILSNNFTVGLSSDGKFNIYGERTLDAVVDVSGYYAPPTAGALYYHPLPKPVRLLDTRAGQGNCDAVSTPITGGTSLTTLARVTCEGLTIPTTAQAIVGNATVINGSGQTGYLTIYPNGVTAPLAANLIYFPGQIISNAFTVSLNASGEFNIFGERTIDMVIDVAGYYSNEAVDANGAGLLLTPLTRPLRILDTRPNAGNCDAVSTPITGGTSIATAGRLTCESLTIPASAQSILGNVTVINQTATAGFLTLYPDGVVQPLAANMIYFPNQILSNAFVVGLNSGTGQFRIFAERTLDAVVDVSGFFAP